MCTVQQQAHGGGSNGVGGRGCTRSESIGVLTSPAVQPSRRRRYAADEDDITSHHWRPVDAQGFCRVGFQLITNPNR